MILVTGTLHARADTLAEVLALSREHVLRSRAESGCLEQGVAIDADDAFRLVFFERWADAAAISAHIGQPASREFGRRVSVLVDQAPTLTVFDATERPLR